MAHAFDPERWYDPDSFVESWKERSGLLLDLIEQDGADVATLKFVEFGCGPLRPFARCAAERGAGPVTVCDLKAWSDDVVCIDLDDPHADQFPDGSVAILSGVLEYVRNVDTAIASVLSVYDEVLMSYCPLMIGGTSLEADVVQLEQRLKGGWKNHLTLQKLLDAIASGGYVVGCSRWTNQVLLHIRAFR